MLLASSALRGSSARRSPEALLARGEIIERAAAAAAAAAEAKATAKAKTKRWPGRNDVRRVFSRRSGLMAPAIFLCGIVFVAAIAAGVGLSLWLWP